MQRSLDSIERVVWRWRCGFIKAGLFLALLFAASSFAGELYKWVDEKGTVHFTDNQLRIPEEYRVKTDTIETTPPADGPDVSVIDPDEAGPEKTRTKTTKRTEPSIPPREPASSTFIESSWYRGASGYDKAFADHKRMGVPLAVYFYTDWCGFCRKFEAEVLPLSRVRKYTNGFLKVRINPERGSRERAIANSYGVRSYPSFFLYPRGSGQYSKVHALFSPSAFIKTCKQAM